MPMKSSFTSGNARIGCTGITFASTAEKLAFVYRPIQLNLLLCELDMVCKPDSKQGSMDTAGTIRIGPSSSWDKTRPEAPQGQGNLAYQKPLSELALQLLR
ncbi:hypothetical protein Tco_0775959 [Tanacetum coccineum]